METDLNGGMPPRFVDLKQEIASSYPDFEQRATKAWNEILGALEEVTKNIAEGGSESIAQVNFSQLDSLTPSKIEMIKRKGCVVIRDVVDDAEARGWKDALEEFIKSNPDVEGQSGRTPEGVDLSTPLSYADRFRIRRPGIRWDVHPPHVDGGAIERWQDEHFRMCFADILSGDWRAHDPYDLEGRLNARSSLYGRPNQSTVFRTFQGWLALSETAPTQGTLKVFPDVLMSNAYLILRPFFRPRVTEDPKALLDPENWAFDIATPEFPGIFPRDGGFAGPRPTPALHPHLRLEQTMISVPAVKPGDMVFWHCDVIHSVEEEHTGKEDSAVMYIPAVPSTPQNEAYVKRQFDDFVKGKRPADFPKGQDEIGFVGVGRPEDVVNPLGRRAMGAPVEQVPTTANLPPIIAQLFEGKARKGLTFDQIAKELGKDEVWVASAFYGQAKFTPDELKKVAEVVGINSAELVQDLGDHWWPNRGLGPIPPTDPVIYRLYEGVLVYGHAIKAVIHEKFGDGIMSMIDCKINVDRKPDPKGDRVVLTFDGKFLSYAKW
ncbi:hypothetical protein EYR36_008299 [Pleurotus pulmonarius]|nr:hypothetical protein EYR36_008299 [Pleurotus pulmonarius]